MKRRSVSSLAIIGLTAVVLFVSPAFAPPALAQVAPPLGSAASFTVLGASTVTNTGPTVVTGNLGVSPGSAVTGFPPGMVVGGTVHAADALAAQAQVDAGTAFNNLAGQACTMTTAVPTDLGGMTLPPGVYCFGSSLAVTGALTLNAGGNPNAVFIFKTGSTFNVANAATITVIGGGSNCNVFYQVGSSATLGTSSTVAGNIIALASVTLTTTATLNGRAIARTGAVTLDSNTIGGCAVAVVLAPPAGLTCPPAGLTVNGVAGTGSVSLSAPAPAGGTVVFLTSSAPGTASVPASVIVPAGATSVTFAVTPGATPGSATITATTAGGSASCTFTVGAAAVGAAPAGGPTLDSYGLAILLVLLAGAGFFAVNRLGS
jgi:hypothetical protein